MQEMPIWSLGGEDPLEEDMATHTSILAWKISWTEEPADHGLWDRKESDMTGQLSTVPNKGFPSGSVVKNLPANAGDPGSIPESGISPGEQNGNPLQSSCLENTMDRGAWGATVHGVERIGHNLLIKQ